MLITIAGVQYVTTSTACQLLTGSQVTPALIRRWTADPHTPLDVVRDPQGQPVRVPGRRGRENLYRWLDVVQVEYATRTAGTGRPRQGAPRAHPKQAA